MRLEFSRDFGATWHLLVPLCAGGPRLSSLCSTELHPASVYYPGTTQGWRREMIQFGKLRLCGSARGTCLCFCTSLLCAVCVTVFLCSAAQWGSAGIRGFIQAAQLRPHGPWTAFTSALSAWTCVTATVCVCAALTAAAIRASLVLTAPFQMCQTWISWRRISKVQKQTDVIIWHDISKIIVAAKSNLFGHLSHTENVCSRKKVIYFKLMLSNV